MATMKIFFFLFLIFVFASAQHNDFIEDNERVYSYGALQPDGSYFRIIERQTPMTQSQKDEIRRAAIICQMTNMCHSLSVNTLKRIYQRCTSNGCKEVDKSSCIWG